MSELLEAPPTKKNEFMAQPARASDKHERTNLDMTHTNLTHDLFLSAHSGKGLWFLVSLAELGAL